MLGDGVPQAARRTSPGAADAMQGAQLNQWACAMIARAGDLWLITLRALNSVMLQHLSA